MPEAGTVGISIGVVGGGNFSDSFIPLFQAHPDVREVRLAELIPKRRAAKALRHHLDVTYESFEELCASDVDAIAVFTQRWTHGPLVVQALKAGKNVYSCVPMGITVEEVSDIVDAVRATGLIYMMGETSYYSPAAVFCRQKVVEGAFGRVFYAEDDYVHDMDLGFYDAYRRTGGEHWKELASFPPMLYPTHAIGGVLAVTGAHATTASCLASVDDRGDGVFDRTVSRWDNDFSNATALFSTSDGGAMRTSEMRRVGYPSYIRESRLRMFGTEGSFEQLATVSLWQTKDGVLDVSEQLATGAPESAPTLPLDPAAEQDDGGPRDRPRDAFNTGYAAVHDRSRLPASFAGLPNGHEGSHHFLADDFVSACVSGRTPPVNAWTAARYTVPGIVAHESALKSGERLAVPDFGSAPG